MSGEQQLPKVYSDRAYVHTTTVRHQGTTVALAMDDQRRLVYTVLALARHDESKGELDAAYWSENPLPLHFPSEIADVGFAAVGATALPAVKRGGRVKAAPGERLDDDEVDPFLSTTARLTALAPFHALSDGTHIVVLRQSVDAAHPDAVHKLAGGASSGDPARTDYAKDAAGAKVPLVAVTLLCDRFLLVGGELKPVLEARYRRSRHRTRPDSAKDSRGTTDMEGRPFHEPTKELSFVRHLSGGRFTALLVPTAVHGQQRWQIFAHNDATGTGALLLGRALAQGARAELDEVRVWDRARTADELKRDKGVRLIGNDPGLVAYYRFDEGSGTRLHDQTDHGRHGELVGGPRWVTSEAPIGDHPGVRRDSFAVVGRKTVSGLSAVLYHQQEDTAVGYGQEPKPAKRQARVLLSYATSGLDPKTGTGTGDAYLATVDFGVGRDGRLAHCAGGAIPAQRNSRRAAAASCSASGCAPRKGSASDTWTAGALRSGTYTTEGWLVRRAASSGTAPMPWSAATASSHSS